MYQNYAYIGDAVILIQMIRPDESQVGGVYTRSVRIGGRDEPVPLHCTFVEGQPRSAWHGGAPLDRGGTNVTF